MKNKIMLLIGLLCMSVALFSFKHDVVKSQPPPGDLITINCLPSTHKDSLNFDTIEYLFSERTKQKFRCSIDSIPNNDEANWRKTKRYKLNIVAFHKKY